MSCQTGSRNVHDDVASASMQSLLAGVESGLFADHRACSGAPFCLGADLYCRPADVSEVHSSHHGLEIGAEYFPATSGCPFLLQKYHFDWRDGPCGFRLLRNDVENCRDEVPSCFHERKERQAEVLQSGLHAESVRSDVAWGARSDPFYHCLRAFIGSRKLDT